MASTMCATRRSSLLDVTMCESLIAISTLVLVDEFGRDEPCRNVRYDFRQCGCVYLNRCKRHPQDHLTLCCRCPDPKATYSVLVLDEQCRECQYKELAERSMELMKRLKRAQNDLRLAGCKTLKERIEMTTLPHSAARQPKTRALRIQSAKIQTLSRKVFDMTKQVEIHQEARSKALSSAGLFGVTGMDKIGCGWWFAGKANYAIQWFTGEQDDSLWKWDQEVSTGGSCLVLV